MYTLFIIQDGTFADVGEGKLGVSMIRVDDLEKEQAFCIAKLMIDHADAEVVIRHEGDPECQTDM